jgi:hypothetical protein
MLRSDLFRRVPVERIVRWERHASSSRAKLVAKVRLMTFDHEADDAS